MYGEERRKPEKNTSVSLDIFVVLLCVTGIVFSLYLFYIDMFKSYRSATQEPLGIVIVRQNIVQRRLKDRNVWDRLFEDSPVYDGDFVRIARLSGATLNVEENSLELEEYTLIRVTKREDLSNIEFLSGKINIISGYNSGKITLSLGDRVVQTMPGSAFSAYSQDNGYELQVTEGMVQLSRDGRFSYVPAGTVITQDYAGNEVFSTVNIDTAVTRQPNVRNAAENTVAPNLIAPEEGRVYSFYSIRPEVHLRWSPVSNAVCYQLEVSDSPDFIYTPVSVQVQGTNYIVTNLEEGNWHWRVLPVFPVFYEGVAGYSQASVFYLDRMSSPEVPALNIPVMNSTVVTGENNNTGNYFSWDGINGVQTYTILVSGQSDLSNPVIRETTRDNYYIYREEDNTLTPGLYYWGVVSNDSHGDISLMSEIRPFIVASREFDQKLVFPPDNHIVYGNDIEELRFYWETDLPYNNRFQVSSVADFSYMELNIPVTQNSYRGLSLPDGNWYWRISASFNSRTPVITTEPRKFSVRTPVAARTQEIASYDPPREMEPEIIAPSYIVSQPPPPPPEPVRVTPPAVAARPAPAPRPAVRVTQPVSPPRASASVTAPQTAPQTAPRVTEMPVPVPEPEPITAEPLETEPAVIAEEQFETEPAEITEERYETEPAVITEEQFEEEPAIITEEQYETEPAIITEEQYETEPAIITEEQYETEPVIETPAEIALLPEPLPVFQAPITPLAAPGNRRPVSGTNIGAQELRQNRSIEFSWSTVPEANAYVLTIYREGVPRRRVFQSEPLQTLSFTLENLRLLESSGSFTWQVEAINVGENGRIERRGNPGENTFYLDVPQTQRVQTRDMGVLYGN